MIRTTTQLIQKLKKIGEQKIEQGVRFKELALSIQHSKQQKTFKEWHDHVKKVLDLELKGGIA